MVVSLRSFALALAAIAIATARAHLSSHDNILRIQLWDAEGLSRDPITTQTPTTKVSKHKLKVNLDLLNNAMLEEGYGSFGRFTRHKVRHKRRKPRQSGTDLPWRFHSGDELLNVAVYNDDVPWNVIEGDSKTVNISDIVSASANLGVEDKREVSPPMTLRQDDDEEEGPKLPVVPKCCASGQNLSITHDLEGNVKSECVRTTLTFQPMFYKSNDTHIWSYDSNLYETIVGNPCIYDRYRLEPDQDSNDEFYLLVNGSLFVPYSTPPFLGTKDFCMETFWNESNPAGVTLPLVCFTASSADTSTSATLIAYAIGLLISVPFLLFTAFIYIYITELRDTHGKSLACHTICLAMAFLCLAATQLAGHAFPITVCSVMAYLIQFSFVSCFFWLNVMCFDTFLNVRRYIDASLTRRSMRRRFAWYCAYAVVLPVVLLIVTITMDLSPAVPSTYLKPNFGVKGCWFKTDQAALPYFYGPVAVILITNVIFFVLTSRAFAVHYDKLKDVTPLDLAHSDFSNSDDWVRMSTVLGQPLQPRERPASPPQDPPVNFGQRLKRYKKIFRKCCILSFIMGLSWALEVVSWAAGAGSSTVSVWSMFDLINALQGVVIFCIFVLQQPVRHIVLTSKLFKSCRRKKDGSEVSVVSERNSIIGPGKRDYV
ncbi:G-protein coupled receptor Mth2 [Amyelois transitella]|uniref:G-protein coupled receptor Mth2 n=1 Tax=Amyelois transitella TaxID=680683 RepID=UPI00067C28FE|nr:G-protein coupled receptor Mth2 [Amyelois transitella]